MCKLLFVALLVVAAVVADDTAERNATQTDIPTSSGHGGSNLDTCRTTFNNTLVGDMLRRKVKSTLGLTDTSDRPAIVPLSVNRSQLTGSCVNNLDLNAVTYGYRVDPDQGACGGSVLGLYDNNGKIVGIQVRFPFSESADLKSPDKKDNPYQYNANGFFNQETINGKKYYVITAYYMNPANICSTGRTTSGPLEQLSFQGGKTPDSTTLLIAPNKRADALNQQWSNNNCFPGMGKHTFNNVESWNATQCTQLKPFFLLFNDDDEKLVGFGFDWVGLSKNCRFEQPPIAAIKLIVGNSMPQCLEDFSKNYGVTTMHVFFTTTDQTCNINPPGIKTIKDLVAYISSAVNKIISWFG